MSEIDGYRRAKHDMSNRLQLLSAYMEMGKYDAAEAMVKQWASSLRNEQAFIMLDWPLFVAAVLHEKIMDHHYRWQFHVDVNAVNRYDERVCHAFLQWMNWLKNQEQTARMIDITVTENTLDWQVEFAVSGQTEPPDSTADMHWLDKNNGRVARLVLKK